MGDGDRRDREIVGADRRACRAQFGASPCLDAEFTARRGAMCDMWCDTMIFMKVPVSARLDAELVAFLDGVRESRRLQSRSEALELAIRALRDVTLEADYAAALGEWSAADAAAWDAVASDGIDADAPR